MIIIFKTIKIHYTTSDVFLHIETPLSVSHYLVIIMICCYLPGHRITIVYIHCYLYNKRMILYVCFSITHQSNIQIPIR